MPGNGTGSLADAALRPAAPTTVSGTAGVGQRRFRPEWIPTLVLAAVLALTLSAGRWQLDRAAYKLSLQQRIESAAAAPAVSVQSGISGDPAALAWHPIEATGQFDAGRTVFLDNRLRDGVPGYEVLVPLRLSGSDRVLLVNRGWVAAPRARDNLPQVDTPSGEVRVAGLAFVPSGRFMELRADTDDARRWQNWTIERARERWSVDLLPVAMLQSAPAEGSGAGTGSADALARNWPRPDVGIDKHRGYALQWFSFAGIGFIVWLVLSLRRMPPGASPSGAQADPAARRSAR
jgi:surfeit locus 1 family protein